MTKEIGMMAGREAVSAIGENFVLDKAKKVNKLSKLIKVLDEKPVAIGAKEGAELANEIVDGLEEYPELAKALGERINRIQGDVYGK